VLYADSGSRSDAGQNPRNKRPPLQSGVSEPSRTILLCIDAF